MPFQPGQRVGDYEVQQMLGIGGMGHVYRVRNIISNRTEAMKVLLPDLTAEPDLAMRFIAEIRTLASFDHPNIAQLHTALQADNQLIMMMEYVEGYTLEQIAGQRVMPVSEVAGYISQALSALSYAHSHGVVHRDIKPANLMVTSHGILKLMDFGIAKSQTETNNQTKPGTTIGSLYYMSPEQVRGSTVDARSDLYSIGIVLYELLAGRRPFEAETTFSILNQQLNTAPQPPIEINPALPQRMNDIILMALAKDPAHRFQNADAFRNALKSFCATPGGQEIYEAVPSTPAPAAAFTPVPTPVPPTPVPFDPLQTRSTPVEAAAAATPYNSIPAVIPPRPAGNKTLWIATGAIAAVLAIAAVAFAVPHYLKTHAAVSDTVTTTPDTVATVSTPSTAPVISAPSAPDTSTPSFPTQTASPASPSVTGGSLVAPVSPLIKSAHGTKGSVQLAQSNEPSYRPPAPVVSAVPSNSSPMPPSPDMSEGWQRLTETSARAATAKRGVNQIRSQQEASGLGLRGDVQSAESRLDAYMADANNDMQRNNLAAATRDLNKADAELAILEKFLGH